MKYPQTYVFLYIASLFFTISCPLLAINVTLELDKIVQMQDPRAGTSVPAAFIEETFILKAIIKDGDRNAGTVNIQGLNEFHVDRQSRSTNITMVNNHLTSITTHMYTLRPKREGIFTIGPASIDKSPPSNTVTLHVIKRPANFKHHIEASKSHDVQLFGKIIASKESVVVGEPTIISLKIYIHGQAHNPTISPFVTPDFLFKQIGNTKQYKETLEETEYFVLENQYELIPLTPGTKKIDPITIEYHVPKKRSHHRSAGFFGHDLLDDFFGPQAEQRHAKTNELNLVVESLPPHDSPIDGIGEFSVLRATLNKTEAQPNEPLIYSLTIVGHGNIDQMSHPRLGLPSRMKHYSSKSNFIPGESIEKEGKKIFEYVIQIPQNGNWEIPAQTFTFFDTKKRKYRSLFSESLPIIVASTEEAAAPHYQPHSEAELGEPLHEEEAQTETIPLQKDVHFIQEDGSVASKSVQAIPLWLFLLLILLPLILFISNFFEIIRSIWYQEPTKKKICAIYEKQLEALKKKGDYAKLYQFFLSFFAERYQKPVELITQDWIHEKLTDEGFSRERIQEFMDFLNECIGLKFTTKPLTLLELTGLFKKSKYWLIFLAK
jgi:hypothetical protein